MEDHLWVESHNYSKSIVHTLVSMFLDQELKNFLLLTKYWLTPTSFDIFQPSLVYNLKDGNLIFTYG